MHRQLVIEVMRNSVQLRKPGLWNGREIVVLVVQSKVEGEEVKNAVVRVRVWDRSLVVRCGS